MKGLRVFCNFIIGIVLFSLIFSLLFVRETNKIISGDILKKSINNIVSDISNNDMELTESQKEAIDDIFKDEEAKEIVSLLLKNYKGYRNDKGYVISEEDIKTYYNFIHKYKDDIRDSKLEKMTEEEFKEYFNNDKIKDMTSDMFRDLDKVFDSKVLDRILDGYAFATSYYVRLALLFVIIFFIILSCLINWSLIRWMITFGVSLIASGFLFNILYAGAEAVKGHLFKDSINISINLNSFLFVGIIQIILGVILIILHGFLKRKVKYGIERDIT